jgi:integrase
MTARPRRRSGRPSSSPIVRRKNGYITHARVTARSGRPASAYICGRTRGIVQEKHTKAKAKAAADFSPATVPTVEEYLTEWLATVVRPSREPATYFYYEAMTRRYIIPALGAERLDALQTADVQYWLDKLAVTCQCCARERDAARSPGRQRCCATGQCCQRYPSYRTLQAARNTLRAALNQARASRIEVRRNAAAYARVPGRPRRRRDSAWAADEAVRFLTSARDDEDPLYAAYVLILINALQRGEVLGMVWPSVGADEIDPAWQLQRVGHQLIHRRREALTGSVAAGVLPLPGFCADALRLRRDEQDLAREQAGDHWHPSALVFTTRWGTPVDPRNFSRSFDTRCRKAGVPRIRVHDTRQTCPALLTALGVPASVAGPILQRARLSPASAACADRPGENARAALRKLSDGPSSTPDAA